MAAALVRGDPALGRRRGAEHRCDVVAEAFNVEAAGQVRDGPAHVGRPDVEDGRYGGREAADHQLVVEEHGSDVGAFEQVVQVVVGAIERIHLAAEFDIDGMQFLVDGLELFLGSLQFLVRRLQLFIDRYQLFVGGLQFLQRRFVFLDDRLEPVAGLVQLALHDDGRVVRGRPAERRAFASHDRALIGERDQQQRLAHRAFGQGFDGDADELHALLVDLDGESFARGGASAFQALAQKRAQVETKLPAGHRQQLARRRTGRGFQVLARAAGEIHHVAIAIDHDVRGSEAFQHLLVDRVPQRKPAQGMAARRQRHRVAIAHRMRQRQHGQAGRGAGPPLEDAMTLVDGSEEVAEMRDVLRRTEEQETTRSQRIVKGRDDLVLHFHAEIDQQVAAGDKVDARERRIADHAVR